VWYSVQLTLIASADRNAAPLAAAESAVNQVNYIPVHVTCTRETVRHMLFDDDVDSKLE